VLNRSKQLETYFHTILNDTFLSFAGRKDITPEYKCVLALYSSKQILVEEMRAPEFLLADIMINMCISELMNVEKKVI
jgi:hypothetical protein